MCVCACVCVCVCGVHVHARVCVCMHAHVHVWGVCMHVSACLSAHVYNAFKLPTKLGTTLLWNLSEHKYLTVSPKTTVTKNIYKNKFKKKKKKKNRQKKKEKKKEGKARTSLHFVVTESTHNISIPQWVELAAAVVHHSRQPGMKPWGCVAKPVVQALLLYATHTHRGRLYRV